MSVPPDILAALQGGGAAPEMGAPAGVPEDMLAMLGPALEEEGAPSGALHGGGAAEGDPEEHYREALEHLEMGIKSDVDEARIQTVLTCITKIQGELAASQKGMDGMASGKFDQASMRRMSAPDQAY